MLVNLILISTAVTGLLVRLSLAAMRSRYANVKPGSKRSRQHVKDAENASEIWFLGGFLFLLHPASHTSTLGSPNRSSRGVKCCLFQETFARTPERVVPSALKAPDVKQTDDSVTPDLTYATQPDQVRTVRLVAEHESGHRLRGTRKRPRSRAHERGATRSHALVKASLPSTIERTARLGLKSNQLPGVWVKRNMVNHAFLTANSRADLGPHFVSGRSQVRCTSNFANLAAN